MFQASRSKPSDIVSVGLAAENLKETQGQLHEWRINLITGVVTERMLSEVRWGFHPGQ